MEATLTCAICLSLFEEPVTLPCSHNFCRTCVVAYLCQGRRPVEQAPPSPLRPPPQSHERPRRQEAERGSAPNSDSDAVFVSCPLCRKACALPARIGAAGLPVNTTLAEVVKLFKASHGGEPRASGRALVQEVPCEKHPGKLLQHFCRMCCRPACGQCVSEEHLGVFHSVDLIGAVYQEEKTQNLKEEEIITREFKSIYETLEMKKKQLLDSLGSQKEKRAKEYEIWKKMKDACRKTIEKYLNECEKIVNECDPQHFLEVACNLNHRMKTQIDLIQISSHYENLQGYKQMHMDTTSVVQSIFALHLTPVNVDGFKADVPFRDGDYVVFGNNDRKSEKQKKLHNGFSPVIGKDVLPDGRMIHTQIMSISETPKFGEMSHEEVRYNYYAAYQVRSDDLKKQIHALPQNGRCPFPESPCTINRPPEASLFPFSAKGSNVKLQVLQRKSINETSLSKSLGYLFNTPAMNLNFSGSSNSFSLFDVKGSQKDSQKTSLSDNSDPLLTTAQIPQADAATLSLGVQTSVAGSPDLLHVIASPVAVLNQHSSGTVTEHTTPTIFSSSSGKGPDPALKNENSFSPTLFPEKPESQNSNVNNINFPASTLVSFSTTTSPKPDSAESKKMFFSAFLTTSEKRLRQPNEQQSLFLLSPPIQNKNQENQLCCEYKQNTLRNSTGKRLTGNCNLSDSLSYKTCAPREDGASENQPVCGKVSANYFWETNTAPAFSFPGSVKNNWDAQTSSLTSADKTKNPSDKSKMESKTSSVKESLLSSNFKDLRTRMHSSSNFFMEKLKSEVESIAVSQEVVAHNNAAKQPTISSHLLTKQNNPLENLPRHEKTKEDLMRSHSLRNGASCVVNADSNGEYLNQASNSSDSRSPSEDKICPR
ncbi:uncharacterized protein LOC125440146 isoform X3 [Sphaerodactylus townsendi]|uniref:uncharacterized protein LOC125440146 isoform X3 n=1 Tax=Sphaerodactylus townsendi TaxID=933632 RepID=UPI0020271C05|nr:uncharacterized protein LOC125440146 isoform X3 [Sphaerodactylus townsendi]